MLANAFILRDLAKKLRMEEPLPLKIKKTWNTSMTSIALLIADDVSDRIASGRVTKMVIAGFGVCYSWAASPTEISESWL
jgi:hypothetical protein